MYFAKGIFPRATFQVSIFNFPKVRLGPLNGAVGCNGGREPRLVWARGPSAAARTDWGPIAATRTDWGPSTAARTDWGPIAAARTDLENTLGKLPLGKLSLGK